jgi:hypothetical protein
MGSNAREILALSEIRSVTTPRAEGKSQDLKKCAIRRTNLGI